MRTGTIEIRERLPQPAAVVRGHVAVGGIAQFLGTAFGEVARVLEEEHGDVAGPPFARYHRTADGFDVEAGFPAAGPFAPVGRVERDELPGGPTASLLEVGPYEGIEAAWTAVSEWLTANGYAVAGDGWESYLDDPDVPRPRTLVSIPCRPA